MRGYEPVWTGTNLLKCRKTVEGKGKAILSQTWTGLDRPIVFQVFEAPIFQVNRHMKLLILSAVRTGRVGGKYYFHIMTPKS
jgi:hypothetical protein